ncbi:MAG: aspartate--tRNA ligase [Deltaproteobacteria bacterium]|nr:MAG: aspartate--tRNA ligase [Deltaproteobacteria bacterium]
MDDRQLQVLCGPDVLGRGASAEGGIICADRRGGAGIYPPSDAAGPVSPVHGPGNRTNTQPVLGHRAAQAQCQGTARAGFDSGATNPAETAFTGGLGQAAVQRGRVQDGLPPGRTGDVEDRGVSEGGSVIERFENTHRRTHDCGQLRAGDTGKKVRLCGWVARRRDLGGFAFVDLRDRYGVTQVVFEPDNGDLFEKAKQLRPEWVIGVEGTVRSRGENANPNLATGEIEVVAENLTVFNTADTPPFLPVDKIDAREELRLKYRYIDLRRPTMKRNLLLRHEVMQSARNSLCAQGFVELETPALIKNTPGGARNFLVPCRLQPGTFYALSESPQVFKQLFMMAGFDRYFQLARCFRDEDLRGDRQPEFTQIDLEMSFVSPEDVFGIVERLMADIYRDVLGVELSTPFPHMSWRDAEAFYRHNRGSKFFSGVL